MSRTVHTLQILEDIGTLPNDCYLLSLDVESLYTNIPTDPAKAAVKDMLNNHSTNDAVKPSNDDLIRLLDSILTKNNFQLDSMEITTNK